MASCWAIGACLGCSEPVKPGMELLRFDGPTMGTRYAVTVVTPAGGPVEDLRVPINARLAELLTRMSTYDAESELSRFNASDSTEWSEVSVPTASVARAALQLAEASGGAYDPTVGPLVDVWGFGPGKPRKAPPKDEEIAAAAEATGHMGVEARLMPPALRKRNPAARLDLSSIAKGHGVDAIARLLDDRGFKAYLVEIGGEVRTRGTKPDGKPWRIGIERADEPLRSEAPKPRLQRVVEVVDRSMATSGDYRNYFEHEGVRYSHTIDPTTGRPVTHDLATVTVLAETCRDADGLATALLVLGPTAGYDWAVERGVAALFVRRTTENELIERPTPAWEETTAEPTKL